VRIGRVGLAGHAVRVADRPQGELVRTARRHSGRLRLATDGSVAHQGNVAYRSQEHVMAAPDFAGPSQVRRNRRRPRLGYSPTSRLTVSYRRGRRESRKGSLGSRHRRDQERRRMPISILRRTDAARRSCSIRGRRAVPAEGCCLAQHWRDGMAERSWARASRCRPRARLNYDALPAFTSINGCTTPA